MNLRALLSTALVGALALSISLTANARPERRVSDEDLMKGIDLVGMQLLEKNSKEDTFGYELKLKEDIEDVADLLAGELATGQEIISRIFELDGKSSFKNIFVYVAQGPLENSPRKKGFILYITYQNKSGGTFSVDYDVTKMTEDSLEVVNGPRGEEDTYIVTTGKPLFGHGPAREDGPAAGRRPR